MTEEEERNFIDLCGKLNKIENNYSVANQGLIYKFDIPLVGIGYTIGIGRMKYKGRFGQRGKEPIKYAIRLSVPFVKFPISHMRDDFPTVKPERIHKQVIKAKNRVIIHQKASQKIKDQTDKNIQHVSKLLKNLDVEVTSTQRMYNFLTIKMKDRVRDAEKLFDILLTEHPHGMYYKMGFSEVEMSEPLFVEIAGKLYREHQLNVLRKKLS
jgi:hypothetical protein